MNRRIISFAPYESWRLRQTFVPSSETIPINTVLARFPHISINRRSLVKFSVVSQAKKLKHGESVGNSRFRICTMPPRMDEGAQSAGTLGNCTAASKPVGVPAPYYMENGKITLKPATSKLWRFASWCCLTSVYLGCKFFLKFCTSSTTVHNEELFLGVLTDPKRTRPILTVSNHTSTIDDPLIWGSLPLRIFSSRDRLRWALGAQEICFTTPFLSGFFALGQVVPIVRGAGIYQPAMNFAIDRLNEGKWVHIFPEGKVNPKASMLRFKWGVGRLMMESTNPPIVIPLCLKGPEEIMPEGRVNNHWIPVFGKKVVITYGKPIDFKDTLTNHYERRVEDMVTRIAITDTIFRAISELQEKAHRLEDKTFMDNDS